ncbi:MAG: non-canonical purine NTP pyrophosphatase [Bacteriovoracaceae bacterium]
MIKFILASGNKHKVKEIQEILTIGTKNVAVQAPEQEIEVEESGTTFQENALLKAEAYYNHYKAPVLSDDSGLVVQAIPEELGIRSARFGGEGLNDDQRCDLLLDKLKDVEDRSAYFVCVLCFYISPDEIYYFEGRLEGDILKQKCGEDGFGYDPVFHPKEVDGLTQNPVNMGHLDDYSDISLAMVPQWKRLHSHRSRAIQFAINFFNERNCQN